MQLFAIRRHKYDGSFRSLLFQLPLEGRRVAGFHRGVCLELRWSKPGLYLKPSLGPLNVIRKLNR